MMDLQAKRILHINLERQHGEMKTYPDLTKYIGGVGVGLKLLETHFDADPLVISVGPLNGFFPYASKTSLVLRDDKGVEDLYIGGTLSTRIRFAGLDSIIITGKAPGKTLINIQNDTVSFIPLTHDINIDTFGLPGKRSAIRVDDKKAVLDNYFETPEYFLNKKLRLKNIGAIVLTGTKVSQVKDWDKYKTLYAQILERANLVTVDSGFFPACSGCPKGCSKSKDGELGGNVLLHSLVACGFAENIYSDISTIFSCLNTLGYEYTHEDIENLPLHIQEVLNNLSERVI